MTAGSYPDDGLGEVFLKLGKQGSTLAGVMDAFSMAISISLQYGVPLETYVSKFTNMQFEPAGLTDDPDIRMSKSIIDYIFRRLALDYLPFESRAALGIYTAEERQRQLDTGSYEPRPRIVESVRGESLKARPSAPAGTRGVDHRRAQPRRPSQPTPRSPPTCQPTTPPWSPRPPSQSPAAPSTSAELLEVLTGREVDSPALHDLRHQDAPGRQLLRLRRLRLHLRLQLNRLRQVGRLMGVHQAPLRQSGVRAAAG